jgi:ATP-binding cassette subfamily F protein 3
MKEELLRPEYQSSYSKLTEIQKEIDAMEEAVLADMEVWEELSSQLEALTSTK